MHYKWCVESSSSARFFLRVGITSSKWHVYVFISWPSLSPSCSPRSPTAAALSFEIYIWLHLDHSAECRRMLLSTAAVAAALHEGTLICWSTSNINNTICNPITFRKQPRFLCKYTNKDIYSNIWDVCPSKDYTLYISPWGLRSGGCWLSLFSAPSKAESFRTLICSLNTHGVGGGSKQD